MNDSTTATYMRLKKKIMLNKNVTKDFAENENFVLYFITHLVAITVLHD